MVSSSAPPKRAQAQQAACTPVGVALHYPFAPTGTNQVAGHEVKGVGGHATNGLGLAENMRVAAELVRPLGRIGHVEHALALVYQRSDMLFHRGHQHHDSARGFVLARYG
jgi:hypothetical protein